MFQTLGQLLNAVGRLPIFRTRSTPDIDMKEVHRLHTAGVSWRAIARQLHGPRSTIRWRYERWLQGHPEPAASPEPPVVSSVEPPQPSVKPLDDLEAALGSLREPGAAAWSPEPLPEPMQPEPDHEVDLSEVFWLNSVGGRQFFLVNGQQNAYYAHHLNQAAIGITEWRREYWRLPQFDHAVKLWIVSNMDEDNSLFLRSLAGDERMRATAVIAPPRPWYTVQGLARDRMLTMRRMGSDYRDDVDFSYQFQPLPPARHLGPWLRSPEPDTQPAWIDPPSWKLKKLL